MKTLQKLKAVVSILFESEAINLDKVKERYLKHSTIEMEACQRSESEIFLLDENLGNEKEIEIDK